MALHGNYPIRSRTRIDNDPVEQVGHLKYLGRDVTREMGQFQLFVTDLQNTEREIKTSHAANILLYYGCTCFAVWQ
jgi:hypothetical protein